MILSKKENQDQLDLRTFHLDKTFLFSSLSLLGTNDLCCRAHCKVDSLEVHLENRNDQLGRARYCSHRTIALLGKEQDRDSLADNSILHQEGTRRNKKKEDEEQGRRKAMSHNAQY